MKVLVILLITWSIHHTACMMCYDCTVNNMNITSISLLDTEPCPEYKTQSIQDNIEIQVLQERETYDVQGYQCLIEIDYHVTHCGMHSHASEVEHGWGTVIQELTPEECRQAHSSQVITIFGHKITDLRRNATLTTTMTLAGSVNMDGKCSGGSLQLGNYNWRDVVGVGKVRIQISDHTGLYRVADDKVVTRSGLSCRYSGGGCTDASEGFVTWTNKPVESCSQTSYLVLYRGRANKLTVKATGSDSDIYTIYSIKDGKFLATLIKKGTKEVCNIKVSVTDHPKLLVQEVTNGSPYFRKDLLTTGNMDIFLYVNAKFTQIESHMRTELSKLYEVIVREQCETKRDILRTQLTIATIDPVEFAYTYMKKPGYTAIVMGEQVHLIRCNPVYVSTWKADECYNEMPVNYTGKRMFLAPRSHILQKTGTPVACSVLMQPTFMMSGQWYTANNGLVRAAIPASLSPMLKSKWTYTDAGELASEGIYSSSDLDTLRNQLMYPSERKAITQTVSAAINQDTYISDTSLFNNLITKETVESTFKSFMHDTWDSFLTFGNLFSGIFGLMLIAKLVKWMFDTIVHSRGLYEVYGCGWTMVAAVWDAATTYFLSPARVDKHRKSQGSDDTNPGVVDAGNRGCPSSIFDEVQKLLYHAHAKNTAHYNLRRKPYEFQIDDIVDKRAYVLSDKDKYFSKKLAPKYIKCRVIDKRSPLVYILEDMAGKNLGTWHIKDLKIVNN